MACFCYQAPFGASLHTASFRGLGADWGPWPGRDRKYPPPPPPPPPLYRHHRFIPCQARTQIRDSNTSVRPAGLTAYVSLPSTCMHTGIPSLHTNTLPSPWWVHATAGCGAATGAGPAMAWLTVNITAGRGFQCCGRSASVWLSRNLILYCPTMQELTGVYLLLVYGMKENYIINMSTLAYTHYLGYDFRKEY